VTIERLDAPEQGPYEFEIMSDRTPVARRLRLAVGRAPGSDQHIANSDGGNAAVLAQRACYSWRSQHSPAETLADMGR